MIKYFCVRVGNWKFEDWRLYRWRKHSDVKTSKIIWFDWDPVNLWYVPYVLAVIGFILITMLVPFP